MGGWPGNIIIYNKDTSSVKRRSHSDRLINMIPRSSIIKG